MMLAETESNGLTSLEAKSLKLFMVGVSHAVNEGSPTGNTWLMVIHINNEGNLIVQPFSWHSLQLLLIGATR